MHAPEFWARRSPLARVLSPFGVLYGLGARLRQALALPRSVAIPVVCVGNLTVGGAGKTPTALAIASTLREMGVSEPGRGPHYLTRGYGGRLAGPVRVDPAIHRAADVGDEPLLLAVDAPCWVSRDRFAGAQAAVAAGAQAIVMDDGLQNPGLRKTLSLAVVDGGAGFGNGYVLPAGPLREFAADGIDRVQALVVVGAVSLATERALARVAGDRPVLGARFVVDAAGIGGRRVFAFAGIARPEKFFASLEGVGCAVAGTAAFADHHAYSAAEIHALSERAEAAGAVLVATAKDHVRLPDAARAIVTRVDGRLVFDRPHAVADLLATAFRLDVPR